MSEHTDSSEVDRLQIGTPLPPNWDEDERFLVEGASCLLDYRSLIHQRLLDSYCGGKRNAPNFDYDKFFAATDTLLDVGNILHVASSAPWPSDESVGQLWLYGALQALAVEQDAAGQLMNCFKVASHPNSEKDLQDIRELRIAAVGHPAHHSKLSLRVRGCTYLGHRDFGSHSRFNVVSLSEFAKSVHRVIDVPEIITKQRTAIELNLARVWHVAKYDTQFDLPREQEE